MGGICPLFWMGRAGLLFLDIDTGEGDSLALAQESCSMQHPPFAAKEPPKVSKGRPESPLVASAEAKPSVKREKQGEPFPCPFTRKLFLVRGFARLWADEGRWKGVFFVKIPRRSPSRPLHVFSGKFPASSVKFFLLLPCLNAVEF